MGAASYVFPSNAFTGTANIIGYRSVDDTKTISAAAPNGEHHCRKMLIYRHLAVLVDQICNLFCRYEHKINFNKNEASEYLPWKVPVL
jgi:hypothetical protein